MADPIPIQLGRGTNKGRHEQEGVASLVNCYVERLGEGGKVEWPIYAINGFDSFATLGATDAADVRAMLALDTQVLVVAGSVLYSTNEAGTPVTTVGGVLSDGFVTMARNRRSPNPQVVIVCDGLWFLYEGGSVSQGSDTDLPAPIAVVEIDGYFVFLISDGRWFISGIDDTTVDGLDFTEAQSSPDRNVMAAVRGRELIIMGERSLEFYVDNAGSEDFPFTRIQTASIGCFSAGSVQKIIAQAGSAVDTVIWAATDNKGSYAGILVLDGYSGRKISTPEVDRLILAEPSPASIRSMSWTEDGHAFYAISGTSFTKVFDTMFLGSPEAGWHDRKSYGLDRWRAQCHAQIGQTHIFGDYATNKLYKSNRATYSEPTSPIVAEVVTPPVHMFPHPFVVDALYIDALTGVGVNSATESDADPQLMLDYSDDGGATFGGERMVDLGADAQRHVSIRETEFGMFGANGVSFRMRCSAAVAKGLLGASIVARKLGMRAA
jgi:hypothetical protein